MDDKGKVKFEIDSKIDFEWETQKTETDKDRTRYGWLIYSYVSGKTEIRTIDLKNINDDYINYSVEFTDMLTLFDSKE